MFLLPDVLRAGLGHPTRTGEAEELISTGLVLLAAKDRTRWTPRVLVDGQEVGLTWHRSPAVAKRFPNHPGAANARFTTAPFAASGGRISLELVHVDGTRIEQTHRRIPAIMPAAPVPVDREALFAKVAGLAYTPEPDLADYEATWAALRQLPRTPRDREWLEHVILLNVAARQRALQTRRMLQRRADQGGMAALEARIRELLGPYQLGPHVYHLGLGEPSYQAAKLRKIHRRLAKLGYPSCVIAGSLLGLVRDGGMVPGDDDIDLAVLVPGATDDDVVAAWQKLNDSLGKKLVPKGLGDRKAHLKLQISEHLLVDLFPMWIRDGRVYIWPSAYGTVSESDLLPIKKREWAGSKVRLPANPEPFLLSNYGPDWRTPDPLWHFDWHGPREQFGELIDRLMEIGRPTPPAASAVST